MRGGRTVGIANSPTTPMLSSLRCQNDVACVFASVMLFPPGVVGLANEPAVV